MVFVFDLDVCVVEVEEVGCKLIFLFVCCGGEFWFVVLVFDE